MSRVKYPNAEVDLSSQDGNAFLIVGRVRRALRQAGAPPEDVEKYANEAMSGDYDNLLQTTMRWVEVYYEELAAPFVAIAKHYGADLSQQEDTQ